MNGERVAPPLSPVDGLTITMNSRQVQLTSDFGLTVRFDGSSRGGKRINFCPHVRENFIGLFVNPFISHLYLSLFVSEIILPSTYRNYVRGLCGNYDGITRNEYMKPDGVVVRNLNTFGESWRVSDRQADGLKIFQLPRTVHR